MKVPKAMAQHDAVEKVLDCAAENIDFYKYNVWLKDGWFFSSGRCETCSGGNFRTVQEFLNAKPVFKGTKFYEGN